MRVWLVLLMMLTLVPTVAEAKKIRKDVSEEVEEDEEAPRSKKKAAGIPLDGLWRSDAALGEAEKLIKEKKYIEALEMLDGAIRRNPRNMDAHVDSAVSWLNLNNLDKAKQSINIAMSIDNAHMGSYVISGLIAVMEKDYQQADYALGALRMLCRTTSCPEFQTLQRIMRQASAGSDE